MPEPVMIDNPVLRGFHPDPSIVRVGDDYYIATSTFEWFPGVRLHHSRDLAHWQPLGYALTRRSQLDMLGNPDSGGIWAPALSYRDGKFYLIFTDVKTWRDDGWRDVHNYLVTAPDVRGPWSDPVFLNSSGFDPSLFHDDDGRKWLVNMLNDHRPGRKRFAGIVLQEFSEDEGRLVGPVRKIFDGTDIGVTEAPHLYRRGEYYYLLTAEGGTVYEHAVTVARSRSLFGPYEVDPENPVLTSAHDPGLELQKAGHASLVGTPDGEWYLAHLCGRPLPGRRLCNLGRETALQRVRWTEDGWLRLAQGGRGPAARVPAANVAPHPFERPAARDDFDAPELSVEFQTLRLPADESWLSLRERPGFLRLRGRHSLASRHRQSLVARRLQAFRAEVSTTLEFAPRSFQEAAGLVAYYDTRNYLYLSVTRDEEAGRCLQVLQCDAGKLSAPLPGVVPLAEDGPVRLRARFDGDAIALAYAEGDGGWRELQQSFDAGLLSDEHDRLGFTGTFVGMCVQDVGGQGCHADFDHFTYEELEPHEEFEAAGVTRRAEPAG